MFRKLATFSPWTILVLFVCLAASATLATAQTSDEKAPASVQTVTGCLQKGVEPNGGFYLITAKDKHWELYDNGKVPALRSRRTDGCGDRHLSAPHGSAGASHPAV